MKNPRKIIDRWMNKIRKDWQKYSIDYEDPFKEVLIHERTTMDTEWIDLSGGGGFSNWSLTPCKDALTIMYDGGGYDLLSREAEYPFFRNQLEELLRMNGFLMEDVYTWASIIFPKGGRS